jgi:2-furoyl-CoA dehydrogenase FAD binding subunit
MLTTAREPDELIVAVRFPAHPGQPVAFREMARRHGDFAIIAIAAMIDGPQARIGVGGMAGRPTVAAIALDGAASVKAAVDELASGLEGYDDLHATAGMRRDILRNLAPLVIEEAQRCAA